MTGNVAQDSDVVLQIFYPFREKLSTYRGYPILGDNGLKSIGRSIITTKNRYGVANQVIMTSFYGSVGWFKEMRPANEISDFTAYLKEEDNIPCKLIKEKDLKDDSVQKETEKTPITFKF